MSAAHALFALAHPLRALLFASLTGAAVSLLDQRRAEEDPRYKDVDWRRTLNQLRLYVARRIGTRPIDADDVTGKVLVRVLEPTARPWDPATLPFIKYLGSYANTEIWNIYKSAYHRLSRFELTEELHEQIKGPGRDAEEELHERWRADREAKLYEKLKTALAKEALPTFLLNVFEVSPDKQASNRRAKAAGYSAAEVAAARRKIHREVTKLMDEEAKADAAAAKKELK